jgi:hypothetical protein
VTCHHPKNQVRKINPSQRRSTQAIPAESGLSFPPDPGHPT